MISRHILILMAVAIVFSGCGKKEAPTGSEQEYSLDQAIAEYNSTHRSTSGNKTELLKLERTWNGRLVSGTAIVDEVRESRNRVEGFPLVISGHVETNTGTPVNIVIQVPTDLTAQAQKLVTGSPVNFLGRVAFFPTGYQLIELR